MNGLWWWIVDENERGASVLFRKFMRNCIKNSRKLKNRTRCDGAMITLFGVVAVLHATHASGVTFLDPFSVDRDVVFGSVLKSLWGGGRRGERKVRRNGGNVPDCRHAYYSDYHECD